MCLGSNAQTAHGGNGLPLPIFLIDGDKGGVGKSFVARLLAYLLTTNAMDWVGFDLDTRNAHLRRFHRANDVSQYDWTEEGCWNEIYSSIMNVPPSKAVLIDLPAQVGLVTSVQYPRLMATAKFLRRPIFRFWSMVAEFDSVSLLLQTSDLIEPQNTFLVKNLRNTSSDRFTIWNASKTRGQLLNRGAIELEVPKLSSGVAEEIEKKRLPFADAHKELGLPFLVYDLEQYLAHIQRNFAPVLERLA